MTAQATRQLSSSTVRLRIGAVCFGSAFVMLGGCAGRSAEPVQVQAPRTLVQHAGGVRVALLDDLAGDRTNRQAASRLELFLYGPAPDRTPLLRNPQGMDYRNGVLYVCDQGLPDVVAFDLVGGGIRRLTPYEARPSCPVDVAVLDDGTVMVADATQGAVVAYDDGGKLLAELKPHDAADFRPSGLGRSGDQVIVCDARSGMAYSLEPVDKSWKRLGRTGSEPARLSGPVDACDNDGEILVADGLRAEVVRLTAEGASSGILGARGRRPGQFVRPMQIAATARGDVFVTDSARQSLQLFDGAGEFLVEIPPADTASRDAIEWTLPFGVAVIDVVDLRDTLLARGWQPEWIPDEIVVVSDALGPRSLTFLGIYYATDGS